MNFLTSPLSLQRAVCTGAATVCTIGLQRNHIYTVAVAGSDYKKKDIHVPPPPTSYGLTWTYAGFLSAGGIIGYIKTRSLVSLGTGLGAASILALCGYLVRKDYRSNDRSLTPLVTQLAVSLCLTGSSWGRYAATSHFLPSGLIFAVSIAMSAFYAWALVQGPEHRKVHLKVN